MTDSEFNIAAERAWEGVIVLSHALSAAKKKRLRE